MKTQNNHMRRALCCVLSAVLLWAFPIAAEAESASDSVQNASGENVSTQNADVQNADATSAPKVALSGIQLRLTEPWGYRFIIDVSGDKSDYTEVGAAVLPTEYVPDGETLTENTARAAVVSSQNDGFRYFSQNDNSFSYTVCITGIPYRHFDRAYTVVPYVRYLENGTEVTEYGQNSGRYELPVREVSEALLKQYCDTYTRDELSDITALETLLSGYYAYVDEQNAVSEPDEPETPDEPTEVARYALNEWFFETGTISGNWGTVNTNNKTRAYTPNFIPAENTVITFDSSTGGGYGVLCYDKDKKYLGTCYGSGSWIADSEYNKTAAPFASQTAYYRLVVKKSVNGTDITVTDENRAEVVSPLTVRVAADHTFLRLGDIADDGTASSGSRLISSAYIPTDVHFSASDAITGFTVYWYDANRTFLSASETITAFPTEMPENAAFYRLSASPSSAVTDNNLDSFAASAFDFYTEQVLTADDFGIGTISGSTGQVNTNSTNRLYTPEYIPAENCVITYDKTKCGALFSRYIVLAYKADKSFIDTSGDRYEAVFNPPSAFADAAYYRLAIKTTASMTTDDIAETIAGLRVASRSMLLVPTLDEEDETEADTTPLMSADDLLFSFKIGSFQAGTYFSDMCFVEDELWLFSCSDKASDGSNTGTILRYSVDFDAKTSEYLGSLSHNFGHANSIDYNETIHALTFGNGSGSFSADNNMFYIYENPYEKVRGGADYLYLDDAISYDFADSGLTGKTKINACFYGDASLFLNANNNGYVYRVALGTGSRVLDYGNALSDLGSNGFNGTWDIIRAYEMPDNGAIDQAPKYVGQNYEQCNQGTDYRDGSLYLACGHKAVYYWRTRLNPDGSITRHEFRKYLTVGETTVTSGASGVAFSPQGYRLFACGGWVRVCDL